MSADPISTDAPCADPAEVILRYHQRMALCQDEGAHVR